jgi:putative ABC transport system permease protein
MDVRYAIRTLLKSRGVTLIAIFALALGIGANTAIFSVVKAVLLSPLPYRDPGRLVSVLGKDSDPLGSADFADIRTQARSFESIGACELWSPSLTGRDAPEQIVGMHVTEDLFKVLGVAPLRGRVFDRADHAPGKGHVAVIGYNLWQRSFNGAADIIGKQVQLDAETYTIVGVMPKSFYFAPFWVTQAELWTPVQLDPSMGSRGGGSLRAFARLAPGVDIRKANAELTQIVNALIAAYPASDTGLVISAEPLQEKAVGNIRPVLQLMLGAVGMVLLIACANVANLALARATARQKEIAVRLALGASRLRIAKQFLTESIVLALAGGALGIALAQWGVVSLQAMLQPDAGAQRARLLQWSQTSIDSTVLLFTLGLAIATGILFGLAPAFAFQRGSDVNIALKEGARGSTSGGSRLRSMLVAAEIAIALVLVIGAGLLMRSFMKLRSIDPGFDASNVITMQISVAGRADVVGAKREAVYRSIIDRVTATPGVRSASMTNHLPIAGDRWGFPYWIEGEPLPAPGNVPILTYRSARNDYFSTMRTPILAGRDFTEHDNESGPPVVIINQTLANRIPNAVGRRISFSDPNRRPQWATIVGVVHDIAQSWAETPRPEAYTPYWQDPRLTSSTKSFAANMTLVARTNANAEAMLESVKNAVWSVDRSLPISNVQTLDHAIGNATWGPRFSLFVATLFSALALILAMIGVYGVMAYEITQRTHEIGIRMALGAGTRGVLALIARQNLPVTIGGIGTGLIAAALLVRFLRSMLYQVDALDPATFAGVAVLMLMVAAIAAIVPARRAMRVDPMIALRNE